MAHGHAGITAQPPPWYHEWAVAYAAAEAGLGQAHIVCYGDSLTQGYYADVPYWQYGWAGLLKSRIDTRTGVTAGTGIIASYEEQDVFDARLSLAGTWSRGSGYGFYNNGLTADAAGDTFTFGPVTCESFRVFYATAPSGGAWTAKVDGGTASNYTSNGAAGLVVADISAGSLGSHTLVLEGSGSLFLVAVEAIANPTTGVKVSRIGYSGKATSDLIVDGSAVESLSCVELTSPDLAIIAFGLNEAVHAISTATYKANLSTLVDTLRGLGASVLLQVEPPPNPSYVSTWADYRTAMREVASEKRCGLVDFVDEWIDYASTSLYHYDDLHPDFGGHADMARIMADVIMGDVDPVAASTFDPINDVANLAAWYDGADDTSFTYSSGSLISQWDDKSGNARHMTQSTASNQPVRTATVNSLKAVWFTPSRPDWMTAGDTLDLGTSNISIFAVVNHNTLPGSGGRMVISKYKDTTSTSGSYGVYAANSTGSKYRTLFHGPTLVVATSAGSPGTDTRLYGYIVDRAAGTVTNRLAKADAGTAAFTPDSANSHNITVALYMGAMRNSTDNGFVANWYMDGLICEILVYLRAVDSTERDAIEAYLTTKWNLV